MIEEDPLTVHFKEAFRMMDKDGSGSLTGEELGKMFKTMDEEMTDAQLQIIVNDMDKDGDGEIDLEEFLSYMDEMLGSGRDGELTEERIKELFDACDSDGSGDISAEELRKIYGGEVSMAELDEMIAEVDISGEGELDLGEFTLLMLGIKKEAVEDALGSGSSLFSGSESWGDDSDRAEGEAPKCRISTKLQSRLQSLVNNENLFRANASRCLINSRKSAWADATRPSRYSFSWAEAVKEIPKQDSEEGGSSEESSESQSSK